MTTIANSNTITMSTTTNTETINHPRNRGDSRRREIQIHPDLGPATPAVKPQRQCFHCGCFHNDRQGSGFCPTCDDIDLDGNPLKK